MADNIKKYLTWIVIVSIGIYLLIAWIAIKYFPDKTVYDYISYTVTGVTVLSLLYVQWIWRINPLEKTPRLKKKYTGTFISNHDGKSREMELQIKQNLLNVSVYIKTNESVSKSIISGIHDDCGQMWLTYEYLNTPNANFRSRSDIHYGTCRLLIDDTKSLSGQYFTDRSTLGDIQLKAVER